MQSDICGATNGCGNAAEHEELTLTFRLWLRDLTALLLYVGEGGEGEGGVALLQTPAVFEQHTTTCLKISRVESTSTWWQSSPSASHQASLDAACRRIMLIADPHAYLHTYRDGPMLLLRGAGWHMANQYW